MSTIMAGFKKTAQNFSGRPSMYTRVDGAFRSITWGEYYQSVCNVGEAILDLKLSPKARVGIFSDNRLEWNQAALGAISTGCVPAGIYQTSSGPQASHIAQHAGMELMFVDNAKRLEKLVPHLGEIKTLRHIVLFDGTHENPLVKSWDTFLAGAGTHKAELDAKMAEQKPEDLASLIYTSGTTALPKAVMLTHANLCSTVYAFFKAFDIEPKDRYVSYLPLSHIAEQLTTLHGPILMGSQIFFSQKMETMLSDLSDAQPTIFLGVPRVWEKIEARIKSNIAAAKGVKALLLKAGLSEGEASMVKYQFSPEKSFWAKTTDKILFSKIRSAIGLGQCRLFVSGAAPLADSSMRFFHSLHIPICNLYGLSETTGPVTISKAEGAFRFGSVGKPIGSTKIKIAADGEILIKGECIFAGYLNDEKATREVFDAEGYFQTGDLGQIDKDGYVLVTGRKKNLIITSGGKNISTEAIEENFKSIQEIEHLVVVGDAKPYLAALVTLNPLTALETAKAIGSNAQTIDSLATCQVMNKFLESKIAEKNHLLNGAESIKKIRILAKNFTEDGGELTPTMKVKRQVVLNSYAREIEAIYG